MNRILFRAAASASCASALCLLSACGGGGGGDAPTPTRQFLLASAGLGGEAKMTFANGEQTVGTRDIVGVDPAAPEKGAVTFETAAFSNRSVTLNTFSEYAFANGVVSNGRTRYAVYFKGGRLYKLDARAAGTSVPVPQLLSNLQSSEVCLSNGAVDMDQSFGDPSGADSTWLLLPAPGADGVCNTADDGSRAVRLNMDAAAVPPAVGKPLAPIYQDGTLALLGMVVLSGNQVQRLDANMASPTSLFTVDASTLHNVELLASGLTGWWYFQEAQKLWAVDLTQPAVRTPVATLAPGETASSFAWPRGSAAFIQIDSATGSRIVRVERASSATTVASSATRMLDFVTTPTRLVWINDQGISAAPLTGGGAAAVVTNGTGESITFVFAAGESLWATRRTVDPLDTALTTIDTLFVGASGAPVTTLADTAIVSFLLPPSWTLSALPYETINVVLAEGVAGDRNYRGASLRTYRGVDKTLLTTYGTVPADQPGLITSGGEPLYYGGQGLFLAYDFNIIGTAFVDSIDLYYFDSDAPGLIRVTQNPP